MKLTAQSITKLIRVCRENGVSEIRTDDIHLILGTPAIEDPESDPRAAIPDPAAILEEDSPKSFFPKRREPQPEENFLQEQIARAEDDEAEMLLEDPEEFERRLASGELMDDGNKTAQD